jgi:hypothetical protein
MASTSEAALPVEAPRLVALPATPAPIDVVIQLLNHIQDVVDDVNWERINVSMWDAVTALARPGQAQLFDWPKLEKPARAGGVVFIPGVSSHLVVEAAQRLYSAFELDHPCAPGQIQEDERNRRALWDLVHGAPDQAGDVGGESSPPGNLFSSAQLDAAQNEAYACGRADEAEDRAAVLSEHVSNAFLSGCAWCLAHQDSPPGAMKDAGDEYAVALMAAECTAQARGHATDAKVCEHPRVERQNT